MRLSHLFFTTLRDDPADAEMVSHRLLVRAGYVRQLGSGIYSLLPLGAILVAGNQADLLVGRVVAAGNLVVLADLVSNYNAQTFTSGQASSMVR